MQALPERHPDAVVKVTDRDGRYLNDRRLFLSRSDISDPMELLQRDIGYTKEAYMLAYGPECYTFVNIYC